MTATTPDPRIALGPSIDELVTQLQALSEELNTTTIYEDSCMDPLRQNASIAHQLAVHVQENYLTEDYQSDLNVLELMAQFIAEILANYEACKQVTSKLLFNLKYNFF